MHYYAAGGANSLHQKVPEHGQDQARGQGVERHLGLQDSEGHGFKYYPR